MWVMYAHPLRSERTVWGHDLAIGGGVSSSHSCCKGRSTCMIAALSTSVWLVWLVVCSRCCRSSLALCTLWVPLSRARVNDLHCRWSLAVMSIKNSWKGTLCCTENEKSNRWATSLQTSTTILYVISVVGTTCTAQKLLLVSGVWHRETSCCL